MQRNATPVFLALLMFVSASTLAQAQADEPPKRPGWTPGPVTGQLGSRGKVNVAEGEIFLDAPATRTFLEEGQNIPDGDELGAVLHVNRDDSYWFAIFSYDDSGHVDDSDRKGLEAGAIMEDMIEGNRQGNEERRRRGWTELTLEGWYREPYYDQATNNLTWSTRIASPEGRGINHSVRLLGRTGVMSVALVADADESLDRSVSEFDKMLTGVSYIEGQRYAEFKPGDKVAAYGLAGLIGAGAAGVALKTGLFQKFWKLIVLAVLALVGVIKKVFSKITGRRDAVQAPEADPRSGRF